MVSLTRSLLLAGGLLLLAPPLFGEAAVPLGVQACDTLCQTKETDCDLACDQVAACVDECKKTSEACSIKCREAPPPAPSSPSKPDGSAKPASPPEKAPAAPGKKAPAKAAPAKPPAAAPKP